MRQKIISAYTVFKNTEGSIAADRGMPMRDEQLSTYGF
jgi:hypothetical protein